MGRERRRQPQRVPLTRDIGNKARIRKRVDAQTYMLDIGSRVGSPAIGFYIGSLILEEGELVLVTWREESDLYDIVGPIRQPGVVGGGFFAIGFGGATPWFTLRSVSPDGLVDDESFDPPTAATTEVRRIRFSPDGRFLAITYTDQLAVFAYSNGVIGDRLDIATLAAGPISTRKHGLDWDPTSSFIAVGHDDASGDSVSVYSWDGATLTLEHLQADPASSNGATSCSWHPDGIHLAVGYQLASGGAIRIYSWDGDSLTFIDNGTAASTSVVDIAWSPSGTHLLFGTASANSVGILPWDGSVFSTRINPSAAPAGVVLGVAWYPDETKVILSGGSGGDVTGYTWDGAAFGTKVEFTDGVGTRWGVTVDPTGTFAAVAETGSVSLYGATYTFDGATISQVDTFSGPSGTLTGREIGFPFDTPATPTEQLDASEITYTPADDTDWPTVPDDVAEALDELADRLTGLSRIVDLPLGSFVAHTGSPIYAQVGTNMHAWELDAAADELVVYSFTIPPQYVSGGFFRLRYVMASATTNEVVVSADALAVAEGEDFDAAGTAATVTDTVQAGASDDLGVVDVTPAVTYVVGDRVRAIVGRLGSDGSDDAAGDMWLVGVEFRYTAAL